MLAGCHLVSLITPDEMACLLRDMLFPSFQIQKKYSDNDDTGESWTIRKDITCPPAIGESGAGNEISLFNDIFPKGCHNIGWLLSPLSSSELEEQLKLEKPLYRLITNQDIDYLYKLASLLNTELLFEDEEHYNKAIDYKESIIVATINPEYKEGKNIPKMLFSRRNLPIEVRKNRLALEFYWYYKDKEKIEEFKKKWGDLWLRTFKEPFNPRKAKKMLKEARLRNSKEEEEIEKILMEECRDPDPEYGEGVFKINYKRLFEKLGFKYWYQTEE
ncbi:MAG: hypothetical protein AB1630_10715 [bacterium]